MTEFVVRYQRMPFNYTDAAQMIIEADDASAAYATAWDRLTRSGVVMVEPMNLGALGVDKAKLIEYGIKYRGTSGTTQIIGIDEYKVKAPGRVLAGG